MKLGKAIYENDYKCKIVDKHIDELFKPMYRQGNDVKDSIRDSIWLMWDRIEASFGTNTDYL